MKKGSKIRKCSDCGKGIFWMIPTGKYPLGIFQEVTHKNICEWTGKTGKYLCMDCYNKEKR